MAKALDDLVRDKHIPPDVVKAMERTEPGMLSAALGEMVYARSHDDKMRSVYPEKLYVSPTPRSEHMATKLGFEGHYIKSDVAIARVIELLDALALQYALERR